MTTWIRTPYGLLGFAASLTLVACSSDATSSGGGDSTGSTTSPVDTENGGDTEDETEDDDTDSSSSTDFDESSSGGEPVETCDAEPVDHEAACGKGCPVVLDMRVTCDASSFADPGLRVAPAANGETLLATASDYNAWLMRLSSDAFSADVLPEGFTRTTMSLALDPDARPYLAAFFGGSTVGLHVMDPDGNVDDLDDEGDLFDFEIDGQGQLHLWNLSYPSLQGTERVRDTNGEWTQRPAPVPGETGWHRYTLTPDGTPVGFDYLGLDGPAQIGALIDGETIPVSSPVADGYQFDHTVVSAPVLPEIEEASIPFFVLSERDGGLRVSWPTDEGFEEVALRGTAALTYSCQLEPDANDECQPTCTESGAGIDPGMSGIARTSDGRVWVAWMEAHLDQDLDVSASCDKEVGCFCQADVVRDESTGEIVVAQLDPATGILTEALRLPDTNPHKHGLFGAHREFPRALDLRAFGQELALGARVREADRFDPPAIRVLRIDTASID